MPGPGTGPRLGNTGIQYLDEYVKFTSREKFNNTIV
jgi:hypothetical protein